MEFNDEELKIKNIEELELNEEYFVQFGLTDMGFAEKYNGNYKYNGPYEYKQYTAYLFENENKDIIKLRHSNTKIKDIFDIRIKTYTTYDNKCYIEINSVPFNDYYKILAESWATCNIFKLTNEYILK
jgi:hypothetical protein